MPRTPALATALIAAALVVTPRAAAQRRELTLIAGATYSGATGERVAKSEARPGFLGGVSLRIPRSAQVSFQSEFRVTQRRLFGQRSPSTLPPIQSGPLSDAPNVVYAELAMLFRVQQGFSTRRPVRPYLLLGPYLGARVRCRHEVTEEDGSSRQSTCDASPTQYVPGSNTSFPAAYHILDVGLLGGLGVEVWRLSVGVRIERSFRNLVEAGAVPTSPLDDSKLWSVSVAVEYLLRVL